MIENDPIGTLIAKAGRRPPVDAGRTERVREAVRASWTTEVARQARRRRITWVASLASAAVLMAAIGLGSRLLRSPAPAGPSGVSVERASNAPAVVVGSILARGASVGTGSDARVALRATTGHSVRLDEQTTLRVVSGTEFVLERGAVYVDERPGSVALTASIRIETPLGTIEDLGTQFEARLDGGALVLRVREGIVAVHRGAKRHVVRAKQRLWLDGTGAAEVVDDTGGGSAWSWTESIAPMMEIHGRSLDDFLDWVVRERGGRVRFEDPALAAKAPSIVLRGSIAGMTLDQATASVLTTCGLRQRWEDGVLIVGR